MLDAHLEEGHHGVEPANFGEILHVVAEGAEDDLLLLIGALNDMFDLVLLAGGVAASHEVYPRVVANHLAISVGYDGLVALLDNSFNFIAR